MPFSPDDSILLESSRTSADLELVVQAREGNQYAFEKLFERYNNQICTFMARMAGNDGIGCDLTQETFLKAWEALPSLRDPSRFVSWLYRIATNVAHDHQRRTRPSHWLPWDKDRKQKKVEEAIIAGPEEYIEEKELLKLALAHVSLTYRACLILYIVEELPQRQIAEQLGIKESCISKYVSRGLEELRRIYFNLANEASIPEKVR
ncbi:MAG TPA: RNA polymerase sigma factor [Ktedonobacteraceae bacterium]